MTARRYEDDDTEITLGTGKMLVLFFGLVVLCGLFFGTGYMIGHNSARIDAHNDAAASAPVASLGPKPSAGDAAVGQPVASDAGSTPISPASESANNGQVMDSTTGVPLNTAPAQSQPAPANERPVEASKSANATATQAQEPMPAVSAGGSFFVQVAAVSREEDAQALVNALKRKQYAASVVTNAPADKLFHVEVGPFAAFADADGMKKRLVADGYSAIVKK
jgi:cell division septation protein DedD